MEYKISDVIVLKYTIGKVCPLGQFYLTPYEVRSLRRINPFNITIYLKGWFEVPLAVEESINSLKPLENLEQYKLLDHETDITELTKIRGYLWYLNEHLARLSTASSKTNGLIRVTWLLKELKTIFVAISKNTQRP